MTQGSYIFNDFADQKTELSRLKQQSQILKNLEANFLSQSGLVNGMTVLDLGCGAGDITQILHSLNTNGLTYGIDSSTNLLEKASSKSSSGIIFLEADLYNIPFADNTFDFVYSRFVFQHLNNVSDAFKEVFRILKPNGVFVIMDVDDDYFEMKPEFPEYTHFLNDVIYSQSQRGGDRKIGKKLKKYFNDSGFRQVKENLRKISSNDLGVRNFLEITNGQKLEQLTLENRKKYQNILKDLYIKFETKPFEAEVTLFGVSGKKSDFL